MSESREMTEARIAEQIPGFNGPVVSKDPNVSYINPARRLTILAATALLAGPYAGHGSRYGEHRGENRKPKNLSNDPDRAKGMKPFDIHGVTIYAGTLKAARKKAALLVRHKP